MKALLILLMPLVVMSTMVFADSPEQLAAQKVRATIPALKEGEQYKIINPVGHTDEPTVVEVFSYGCSHCNAFEPFMDSWKKSKPGNVKLTLLPAVGMRQEWDIYAKVFYAAEQLKILDKTHSALFKKIHDAHEPLHNDEEAVAFLASFGVNASIAASTLNSFPVLNKMEFARDYMVKNHIPGTPAFVINEKYFTDASMAKELPVLEKALSELPLKK